MDISSASSSYNLGFYQSNQGTGTDRLATADADGSGGVSLEEMNYAAKASGAELADQAQLEEQFAQFDTDGDGQLTESEMQSGLSTMSSDMLSTLLGMQEAGTPSVISLFDASASYSAGTGELMEPLLDMLGSDKEEAKSDEG